MTNFAINFTNPWLLLLLLPAFGLTLFTYFRLSKKYRRTRNRIVSMALHAVIMVLCISVLAGISFTYDIPNTENEVLLVVDCSDSAEGTKSERDEFVRSAIERLDGEYKVGVVAFGLEPVYAAELTEQTDDVYEKYLSAEVDGTASDMAAALSYAKSLFERPATAKIVLVGDGLETDEDALSVIKSLSAAGIKVDTAYFSAELEGKEVQISAVTLPEKSVVVGETFSVDVTVTSTDSGRMTLTVYDNGAERASKTIVFDAGEETFTIDHSFNLPGFHKLKFELTGSGDTLAQNNIYYAYKTLATYDKILIVDGGHTEEETAPLQALLDDDYTVTVVKVTDDAMPKTLKELRAYDEVILMNVANADMPEGFIDVLYSYVHDVGGGLLTVGGNNGTDSEGQAIANMYNRKDLAGTTYQDMLPVQAIDYTPPVAVMIVIDSSRSMGFVSDKEGKTYFEQAKDGAISALNSLTERDYCGVMLFGSETVTEQDILPVSQKWRIQEAIGNLELLNTGTVYSTAIDKAGQALMAVQNVERRHIILVTDGEPTEDESNYLTAAKNNYDKAGITLSVVLIKSTQAVVNTESINKLVSDDYGHGRAYTNIEAEDISLTMREELKVSDIKEVTYKEFTPTISSYTTVVSGISQKDMPTLSGFYGTKAKDDATVVLSGEYVPIYAQWDYGEGKVGSFMCDLNGTWSADFLASDTGRQLISNMLRALAPSENIRYSEVEVVLTEDNLHTQASIYTDLAEGQSIRLSITGQTESGEEVAEVITRTAEEGYSRIAFVLKDSGIYTVRVDKLNKDGSVAASCSAYRAISYSEEYNAFVSRENGQSLMAKIAENGNGNVLADAWDVMENIEHSLHLEYDPVIPFLIAAIVLFLLDLAVRKFKFKWIHELVREGKEKREDAAKGVKGR